MAMTPKQLIQRKHARFNRKVTKRGDEPISLNDFKAMLHYNCLQMPKLSVTKQGIQVNFRYSTPLLNEAILKLTDNQQFTGNIKLVLLGGKLRNYQKKSKEDKQFIEVLIGNLFLQDNITNTVILSVNKGNVASLTLIKGNKKSDVFKRRKKFLQMLLMAYLY